jgi:hypothetical protein
MQSKWGLAGASMLCLAAVGCSVSDAHSTDAGAGGRSGGSAHAAAGTGAAGRSGAEASGAEASGMAAQLGDCQAFPSDDAWNRGVEGAAVSSLWTERLNNLVGAKNIHPDYGNSGDEHYGIPINRVPSTQAMVPIVFDDYPDESDPGPYPFPGPSAIQIEGGSATACDGDCHVLVVRAGECKLYEGYACSYRSNTWHCSNGAVWDLTRKSEGQRPEGYTSADAAGLPIAPGLVRYDEAQSGEIRHAIRFTLHCSRANYVAPASHFAVPNACRDNPDAPPMGLRVRLRADYDLSHFSGGALAVARAMQRYGMILADNGSDFYFQGEQDARFSAGDVDPLKTIPASAFEALEPGPLLPAP